MSSPRAVSGPAPTLAPIEIRGLARRLGPVAAVLGADLTVRAGTRCALLGELGSGRSTLLRLLLGFLPADGGTARLLGREAWVDPEVRREVAHLGEDPAPPAWMRVRDVVRRHQESFPSWSAERDLVLERALPVDAALRVGDLGRSDLRALLLRLALAQGADVLVLDGPLADVDGEARAARLETIGAVVRERPSTLLFSAESAEDLAGRVTHAAIMSRGRVLEHASVEDLEREVKELAMPITAYNRAAVAIRQAGVVSVRTERLARVVVVRRWSEEFHAAVARATSGEFEHRDLALDEIYRAYIDLSSTGTGTAP